MAMLPPTAPGGRSERSPCQPGPDVSCRRGAPPVGTAPSCSPTWRGPLRVPAGGGGKAHRGPQGGAADHQAASRAARRAGPRAYYREHDRAPAEKDLSAAMKVLEGEAADGG